MADIFVPEDFAAWQIHLRRMFHRRPEIGWCEYWTTSALASECRKMGLAPLVGREIMEDEDASVCQMPERALTRQRQRLQRKKASRGLIPQSLTAWAPAPVLLWIWLRTESRG